MFVLAAWAVLAVTVGACAGPAPQAARASARVSARDQRWLQDIAYLATELPAVREAGLGDVTPAAWHAAAVSLAAAVPRLTDSQIIVGIAQMVAMLHDDETSVLFPDGPIFRFDAQPFGDDLYLLAVPPADRALLGARLLAIDGHPIASVLACAGSVVDAEDPQLLRNSETGILDNGAVLHALSIAGSDASVSLTVRTIAGVQETVQFTAAGSDSVIWPRVLIDQQPGLAHVPLSLYQQNASQPYWMDVLARNNAVYLKYNQCLPDDGFQRLANQAITILRAHPDYRLVIDLRDNPGGDSGPLQFWLAGVTRADPELGSRLIGLVNQFTDSSGTLDAQSLKDAGAVLIGQPPADPIDRWGNTQVFALPNSGIGIMYTTAVINGAGRSLGMPEIVIAPTLAQTLSGDDPVLAAALSYRP
jgi:hypothetical protein